jgi:hypothetical protein
LESAVVEEVVVVPVGTPLIGDVDITVVASDTLVCTPDVEVVVVDTNGDLASALALTLSASELSENSCKSKMKRAPLEPKVSMECDDD